jgi:hypothetical protein
VNLDGLSVNFAFWSVAASVAAAALVILSRHWTRWQRQRREDQGILVLIEAQLQMFQPRYAAWNQTSALLRCEWTADANFAPFSVSARGIDRPYERHRDRLPAIVSRSTFRLLVSFYDDDALFDLMRAAVLDASFRAISVERRLKWLDELDTLAAAQAGRCGELLTALDAETASGWLARRRWSSRARDA